MKNILEIACFNIESALIAEASGANRIELCQNYHSGGITPTLEIITEARKKIHIPIHVIIRPNKKKFIYSNLEIEEMKKSILFCKQHKIDGIVFGVLTPGKEIDLKTCAYLIELARPMSVNFHRAIDECNDPNKSFQQLIDLGFERVLSSGGKSNAIEGLENLRLLQNQFGSKIIVVPAGNIRSSNIEQIKTIGCNEFHSSCIISGESIADKTEIKKIISLINTGINL